MLVSIAIETSQTPSSQLWLSLSLTHLLFRPQRSEDDSFSSLWTSSTFSPPDVPTKHSCSLWKHLPDLYQQLLELISRCCIIPGPPELKWSTQYHCYRTRRLLTKLQQLSQDKNDSWKLIMHWSTSTKFSPSPIQTPTSMKFSSATIQILSSSPALPGSFTHSHICFCILCCYSDGVYR